MTVESITVILAAVVVGSLVKGVTGTGLPTIAIPVMAGFLGVEEAVVIMAIPTVVTNAWMLWEHRSYADRARDLPTLLVAGTLGVLAGVWTLSALNERVLNLTLASLIIAYLLLFVSRPALQLAPALTRRLSPPVGLAAGALQGATGISAPILATYLHAYRLEQRAYLFSVTALVQVFALVQVAGLLLAGLYTRHRVLASLLALVPIVLVLPIGIRLSYALDRRRFEWAVLALLAVMAVKLLVEGLPARAA